MGDMNTHLKVLLYIGLVVGIFYFVQTKYSLFDISFQSSSVFKEEETEKDEDTGLDSSSVEIINTDGKSIFIQVELADQPESRSSGLSGRSQLGDYQGMIFIFEKENSYSFWMQGMLIPLDIIFIDTKGVIVDIKSNQVPCTEDYCPSIASSKPFKYALEVNSGFSRSNRIDIGNEVVFNISSLD
jgi:uncharacterized membrane protein (UPF0127 family)